MEQISTLDGTTFPKEAKPFVCFLETLSIASKAEFVCTVTAGWSEADAVLCSV